MATYLLHAQFLIESELVKRETKPLHALILQSREPLVETDRLPVGATDVALRRFRLLHRRVEHLRIADFQDNRFCKGKENIGDRIWLLI